MALILLDDARRVPEWRHLGHVSKEPENILGSRTFVKDRVREPTNQWWF